MNIYSTITERILKQLDAGVVPWRRTWTTGLPKSMITGKEYRGINILMLTDTGYTSRYWVTFRQAVSLGGHVRKGERATPVIYWKWRTPEEIARRQKQAVMENAAPCVPFTSAVFNLDQVEGVDQPDDGLLGSMKERVGLADMVYEDMPQKPGIYHTCTSGPAYSPLVDQVTMPHLGQFEDAEEYYGTLFHELVHSTGHERRLGRFAETGGDPAERYSFEELVAEFGAAFLCAFAGLGNPTREELHASYIEGWSKVLRKDPRLIVQAASAAQRAADYVRGKVVTEKLAAAA